MDKRLIQNLQDWHRRNGWFDGTSELSKIAVEIEKHLVKKGYKYNTKKLLNELDKRIEAISGTLQEEKKRKELEYRKFKNNILKTRGFT